MDTRSAYDFGSESWVRLDPAICSGLTPNFIDIGFVNSR